jgi:hypothetical protein
MSTSLFGLMAILAMVLGLLIPSTRPASASAAQVRSDHGVSRDTAKGDDAGSDEPDSDDSSSSDSGD